MTLEERENDLFERWGKTLGDTDGVFAKDGVANEERFNRYILFTINTFDFLIEIVI